MSAPLADAYERSHRQLRAVASRYVGAQDAEDILHDAFVRALQHNSFRQDAALTTWLNRIVVNEGLNDCRRRKRRPPLAVESSSVDPGLVTRADTQDGLLIRRSLQSLPLAAQRLCLLHYVMGYSHREIAAALGIPVGTSKSQLHAARHRLRRLLTAPYQSPVSASSR